MAIDPVRPCEVLTAAHAKYTDLGPETYRLFKSTTSGASWSAITTTRTVPLWDIAIDQDERYYVLDGTPSSPSVGYSTNHGATWSYVALPSSGLSKAMAVDNSRASPYEGSVYVVSGGGTTIMRSTSSGTTWPSSWTNIPIPTAVVNTYTGSYTYHSPDIRTGSDGQVYLTFLTYGAVGSNPSYQMLVFAKSTDAGATWTSSVIFEGDDSDWLSNTTEAQIAVNLQNDNLFVVHPVTENSDPDLINTDLVVMRSTDGGSTWSTLGLPASSTAKDQIRGAVACDPVSGAVVVGYLENEKTQNVYINDCDSRVAISYDQGDTWTSAAVNDNSWLALDYSRVFTGGEIDVRYGNVLPLWTTMADIDTFDFRGPLYTSAFEMECPENITLGKATINENALYSVSNTITVEPPSGSQYLIPASNPKRVFMHAGTKIRLLPGFCAKEGSRYKATIQPCDVFSDVDEFNLICQETSISSSGFGSGEYTTATNARHCVGYPNPFNGTTSFRYDVDEPGIVTITIYDVVGNVVTRLVDGVTQSQGVHLLKFDGAALAPGTYLVVVQTASYTESVPLTRVP